MFALIMQPTPRSNRDAYRSVISCAIVACALALVVSLAGPGGASGQGPDYLVPMSPFPVVRIVGEAGRTRTNIKVLSIKGPVGAVVVTRCTPRGRCPYRERERLIAGPAGTERTLRITALQRRFKAGVTLRVIVAKKGFIGKYTSFLTRRRKQPRRSDRCVTELRVTPIKCPTS